MAMTRPKSSQVEHRGETVQKVIDDITQEDGVLSTEPSWTDVPKLKGTNANKQAQALVNRTEFLLENAAIKLQSYEALRAYTGKAQAVDITQHGIAGRFYCKGVVIGGVDNGGTEIIDVEGRLWVREFDGPILASWWGFSPESSGDANRDAVFAAVIFAGKREVIAQANTDFSMSRLDFTNEDINLKFTGGGALNKTSGTVLNVNTGWAAIHAVSDISSTTKTIEGNSEAVTKITTTGAASFSVGDIVRIVSDDLDPNAREGYSARRGEAAYIVAVDSDAIYIPRSLEDMGLYITNVRVGKMHKSMLDITLPVVKSVRENTSLLVNIQARYKANISCEILDHGAQGVQFVGCVRSVAHLKGSSRGGSDGSLGYLWHDRSGTDNKLVNPIGQRCRHLSTTGFSSVDAGSEDLHWFGATRDSTVIGGIAESSQNIPFDDHEGARRTKWINCVARGSLLGTNSYRAAFQARGCDSEIVNPTVDSSYDFVLHASRVSKGVHKIIGGTALCKAVTTEDSTGDRPTVILDNLSCTVASANVGFIGGKFLNVVVNGGAYIQTGVTVASSRVWNSDGGTVLLNSPSVYVTSDGGSGFRWVQTANGGKIIGKMVVALSAGSFTGSPRVFTSTDNTGTIDLEIDWLRAGRPTGTSSTFSELRYKIKDYSTIPVTVLNAP